MAPGPNQGTTRAAADSAHRRPHSECPPQMPPRPRPGFLLGRLGLSEQAFVIKAILQSQGRAEHCRRGVCEVREGKRSGCSEKAQGPAQGRQLAGGRPLRAVGFPAPALRAQHPAWEAIMTAGAGTKNCDRVAHVAKLNCPTARPHSSAMNAGGGLESDHPGE